MVISLKVVNMLEASYKQVMVWLKQMKQDMEEGFDELPEGDEELHFEEWD